MNKFFLSKIVLVLILSFFLSSFLINNIYIGYTPVFRKNLDKILIAKLEKIFKNKNQIKNVALEEKKTDSNFLLYEKLDKNLFSSLSKGVYAQELEGNKGEYILIKEEEVEWIEYTFNIKGREMKIKVPKGEDPPPQKMLEEIYK